MEKWHFWGKMNIILAKPVEEIGPNPWDPKKASIKKRKKFYTMASKKNGGGQQRFHTGPKPSAINKQLLPQSAVLYRTGRASTLHSDPGEGDPFLEKKLKKSIFFNFWLLVALQRGKLRDPKGFRSFRTMPRVTNSESHLRFQIVEENDTCENRGWRENYRENRINGDVWLVPKQREYWLWVWYSIIQSYLALCHVIHVMDPLCQLGAILHMVENRFLHDFHENGKNPVPKGQ